MEISRKKLLGPWVILTKGMIQKNFATFEINLNV